MNHICINRYQLINKGTIGLVLAITKLQTISYKQFVNGFNISLEFEQRTLKTMG